MSNIIDSNIDSESRMTLTVIESQEQELIRTLFELKNINAYISKTSADRLNSLYDSFFNVMDHIQEKCITTDTNINYSKQQLEKCKDLVIEINKVLINSKKILTNKGRVNTLQGLIRTSILDNPETFRDQIDYKPGDIEEEGDTEDEKEAKRERRENNYPEADIYHNVLDQIGEEGHGDTADYDKYVDYVNGREYDPRNDPRNDPLFGTHTFPNHLYPPLPPAAAAPTVAAAAAAPPHGGGIINKTKSNKRKSNKRKSSKRKTIKTKKQRR